MGFPPLGIYELLIDDAINDAIAVINAVWENIHNGNGPGVNLAEVAAALEEGVVDDEREDESGYESTEDAEANL